MDYKNKFLTEYLMMKNLLIVLQINMVKYKQICSLIIKIKLNHLVLHVIQDKVISVL